MIADIADTSGKAAPLQSIDETFNKNNCLFRYISWPMDNGSGNSAANNSSVRKLRIVNGGV
jgi:hypothetical protein